MTKSIENAGDWKDKDNMASGSECESSDGEWDDKTSSDKSSTVDSSSPKTESVNSITCDQEAQTTVIGAVLERILALLEKGIALDEIERISTARLQAGEDMSLPLQMGENSQECDVPIPQDLPANQLETSGNTQLISGTKLDFEESNNDTGDLTTKYLKLDSFPNHVPTDEKYHDNSQSKINSKSDGVPANLKESGKSPAEVRLEDLCRALLLVSVPNQEKEECCLIAGGEPLSSRRLSGGASLTLLSNNQQKSLDNLGSELSVHELEYGRPKSLPNFYLRDGNTEQTVDYTGSEVDVEMVDEQSNDEQDIPAKTSRSTYETIRRAQTRLDQWQWMCEVIPNADPDFLMAIVRKSRGVKDLMDTATKFLKHPHLVDTREGRATRRKWRNKDYSAEEFLASLPDAVNYYYDNTRPVSEQYQIHVETHLRNIFPQVYKKEFDLVMRRCNYHLTSAYHVLNLIYGRLRAGDESRFVKKKEGTKKLLPTASSSEFYKELIFLELENEIKAILNHKATGDNAVEDGKLGAVGGRAAGPPENRKRVAEVPLAACLESNPLRLLAARGSQSSAPTPDGYHRLDQMHREFLRAHPELNLFHLDDKMVTEDDDNGMLDRQAKRRRRG